MFSSCMAAPREASVFVSFSFSSRRMGGMGAGSRADPPPRMQKRWQGHQESRRRRTEGKKGCSMPFLCTVGMQRWLGNYAYISGQFSFNPCCPALLGASYTSPRRCKPQRTQVLRACSGARMMEKGQQLLPLFYTIQLHYQAASVLPR